MMSADASRPSPRQQRQPVALHPKSLQRGDADDGRDQQQVEQRIRQRDGDLERAASGLSEHPIEQYGQDGRRGQPAEQAVQPHRSADGPVLAAHRRSAIAASAIG